MNFLHNYIYIFAISLKRLILFICDFFKQDWGNSLEVPKSRAVDQGYLSKLQNYLDSKGISDADLASFLSENPEELFDFVNNWLLLSL